jgi:hypothetical protein
MLYMANWGSRQLMFRFPVADLDIDEVQAYCQPIIAQDYLSLSTGGEYVILNVEFNPEDSYEWVEGEGWLPVMLSCEITSCKAIIGCCTWLGSE